MPPRQRILAIRLADKLNKNPRYAEALGVVTQQTKVIKQNCSEDKNEKQR